MDDTVTNSLDISSSVNNALTNLTNEPTKNIGHTFGDIWFLVFGGISHVADKRRIKYDADLEKYRQELTRQIDSIPTNKQIEPSLQITAQALENSKYCVSSEILRNMFVKLISGTMNSDIEPLTHPSFPEMIKQMSESDARLLMELKRKGDTFPIAEFRETFSKTQSFVTHFSNAYISDIYMLSLDDCSCSLSSLERMGLITLSYEEHLTNESLYSSFSKTSVYNELSTVITHLNRDSKITLGKGICRTTPLGKRFIVCCVL